MTEKIVTKFYSTGNQDSLEENIIVKGNSNITFLVKGLKNWTGAIYNRTREKYLLSNRKEIIEVDTKQEVFEYLKTFMISEGFRETVKPELKSPFEPLVTNFDCPMEQFSEISVHDILQEININNGLNYKIDILKKYTSHSLFQKVLKMTYDSASYTYGVTLKNIGEQTNHTNTTSLDQALSVLENHFCTRAVTGNEALDVLEKLLDSLSEENALIVRRVIDRDQKINIGTSSINKIYKNLIVKPAYMRCDIFTKDTSVNGKLIKGTAGNISFPAYIQLKADGTYREVTVDSGKISIMSRSGESYSYPELEQSFVGLPDGKYFGELTIAGAENRAVGNGLINSDNIPYDRLIMDLWDYTTLLEYTNACNRVKTTKIYKQRFEELQQIISVHQTTKIQVIESHIVNNLAEALEYVSNWMKSGLEGGILKDFSGLFKDGTSKHQLKLKLEIDAEVRCTGFTQGTKGTDRESTFGAMTFVNDEGTIKGQTSGFNNEQLVDFNSRRDELIGRVFTVQFNDITKGRENDYYALSHPRFICFRDDKDETDTLERVQELKRMAMSLS